jgi:hypothetical protein
MIKKGVMIKCFFVLPIIFAFVKAQEPSTLLEALS